MSDELTPFDGDGSDRSRRSSREGQDDRRSTDDWNASTKSDRRRLSGSWIGGAILILLGLAFLAQNLGFTVPVLNNWWAVFIFIPAVGALNTAWQEYQRNGQRFTSSVRGSAIGGLVMVLVALTFLFNWSWGVIWPVFLILAGLGALAAGLLGR